MALTTYMISQASDHLSDKHKQLWLLLFRKAPKYKDYALVYNTLIEGRLNDAEGTIKARMLNALMKEIDDLGVGEVTVGGDVRTVGIGRGDPEGTYWSQTYERLALIEEGLDVLFDDISTLVVTSGTTLNADGTYRSRGVAYGQRSVPVTCPVCFCTYYPLSGRSCSCR